MTRPRFFVDSLTGHVAMGPGSAQRKPTITWSVFDRAYNCKNIQTFHGSDAEQCARVFALLLNQKDEDE